MDSGKRKSKARLHSAHKSPAPVRLRSIVLICVGITALIWVVFGQTLRAGFINYDDDTYVYENPRVIAGITGSGVRWAFAEVHSSNWHPVTWLSHMADCQFFGLNPGAHHGTNVVLHNLTAIGLFLLLYRITAGLWQSAFTAAVFAIHPLRVESVAWIAERKDVLSGLFFVLTLAAYCRYAGKPTMPRYVLVAVLFAVGLMCKPMLVTLPLVLLLIDYWPLARFNNPAAPARLLMEKGPLLLLSVGSCTATLVAQRWATASVSDLSLLSRLGNAAVSGAVYIGQFFWPTRLAPFYPYPETGLSWLQPVGSLILLIAISSAAIYWAAKRPYFFTGWFWYAVMLVPVIGIVQVGIHAHADRYTYLPEIGLSILLSWTAADLSFRWGVPRPIIAIAIAVAAIALTVLAYQQTTYWHDPEKLWNHSLAVTGDNEIAHNGLGEIFVRRGQFDKAVIEMGKALASRPASPYAQNNLGFVLTETGQLDEAIDHLRTAARILPTHRTVHYNLGHALLKRGEVSSAIQELQEQLALNPDDAKATCELGVACLESEDVNRAMEQFRNAIKLRPDYAKPYFDLGNCYLRKGDLEEAARKYQEALSLSPGMTQARNNLAILLWQNGKAAEAIAQWKEAAQRDPNNLEILNNLTWTLATAAPVRNGAEAARVAERLAKAGGSNQPKYLRTIAAAYAANGQFEHAVRAVQQALQLANQENSEMVSDLNDDLRAYRANTVLGETRR